MKIVNDFFMSFRSSLQGMIEAFFVIFSFLGIVMCIPIEPWFIGGILDECLRNIREIQILIVLFATNLFIGDLVK
jgi:hypothetical protein